MTDDAGEKTPPRGQRKLRRDRQRAAIAAATIDKIAVAPTIAGPGRRRALDPDQATFDANRKKLMGCAFSQMTEDEAAAHLGVTRETLREFFIRYPDVREGWDDTRLQGVASVRRQLFENLQGSVEKKLPPNPQTAMWMGERVAGFLDPYKEKDLELRERAFKKDIEIKTRALDLREREIEAREKFLALKMPTDLGAGLPIDIKSLSLQQLMQLRDRIVQAMTAGGGLTIDAVASKPETEKAG